MKIQSAPLTLPSAYLAGSPDKETSISSKRQVIFPGTVPLTGSARTSLEKINHNDPESIKARIALEKQQREVQITVLKALVSSIHSDDSSPCSSDMLKNFQPFTTSKDALSFGQNLRKFEPVRSASVEASDTTYRSENVSSMIRGERSGPSSSKEICDSVADSIESMGKDYLDVFQQAVEKNAAFYSDFSDFMTGINKYISADDDKTILDCKNFDRALSQLKSKYTVPDFNTTLYPVQSGHLLTGATKEECEAWATEMGLNPDNCVRYLGPGKYIVHIDVSPLSKIQDTYPKAPQSGPKWEMSCNSAQWAAWQSGVDMQKDSIQTAMQTLTQKYSNANSTFDNLVKVLSGTISSLLESDKSFFNI